MTDGWIEHDGGPCPVAPGRLAMINGDITVALPVSSINWAAVKRYRTFARVNPPDPGPSACVRDTAARIMAAYMMQDHDCTLPELASDAVNAALALEAALEGVKP